MGRTCRECGAGVSKDLGTPAYYDEIDGYAHPDCAYEAGYGDTQDA